MQEYRKHLMTKQKYMDSFEVKMCKLQRAKVGYIVFLSCRNFKG